ncbi:MAG TPA: shikimate dehydrogenase [Candidatus Binatia bacterium]
MSRRSKKAIAPAAARVEGTTRVIAILGHPVEHSLSPRMHNAAYAALGLDYVYVPLRCEPSQIRGAVRAISTLGIVGCNVTVPYKQDVSRLVDRLTPAARAIGAVNTIFRDGDEMVGDNTDGEGFAAALKHGSVRVRGARALVIGAGGSARAVLHALREGGASRVVLANRTRAKATKLAREFGAEATGLDALTNAELLRSCTLVVNCTPVGLGGGAFLRYDADATSPRCAHFDLAYGHGPTPFLELARRAGRPTIDGRLMLVFQGAAAFRLFTGKKAPVDVMLAAVGLATSR